MARKVLITGASGFIGSFLVDEAVSRGYEVVAGIRARSSRQFLHDSRVRILELDYTSATTLFRQLAEQSPDFVIHNAGTTGTKGTDDFHEANANNTRRLMDALSASGTPPERLIYMSSLAVQGPGHPETMTPLRVGDPEVPVSAYAQSKLAAEQLLKSAPFPVVILRPTAVYGPRDRDFQKLFQWVQRGILPSIGTHRQQLSMIYVKDLAAATLDLLGLPHARPCYIASDTLAYDKDDIGKIIAQLMNKRVTPIRVPLSVLQPAIALSEGLHRLFGKHPFLSTEKLREVAAANWLCDSRDLWQDLNRQPVYNLEAGLKETWEWYIEQGWL